MSFKKTLAIFVALLASANVSASLDPDLVIIHVTPEFLSAQTGIPLDWSVNYKVYDFAIENETDSTISIAIKVDTLSYPEHVNLYSVSSPGCTRGSLGPQESMTCQIEPKGHVQLVYNIFPKPDVEPTNSIEGKFTLGKV